MDTKYWDRYKYLIRSKNFESISKSYFRETRRVSTETVNFLLIKLSQDPQRSHLILFSFCFSFVLYAIETSLSYNQLWPPNFQLLVPTQIWYVASANVTKESDTRHSLFPTNGQISIQYIKFSNTVKSSQRYFYSTDCFKAALKG